jgi:hypothetical protein
VKGWLAATLVFVGVNAGVALVLFCVFFIIKTADLTGTPKSLFLAAGTIAAVVIPTLIARRVLKHR